MGTRVLKRVSWLLFLSLLLVACTSLVNIQSGLSEEGGLAYTPHDPIYLVGDSDPGWAEFPGTGTVNDPKVIAGYNITGSNHCIWLVNTSLYVVIRNCYLHDGNYMGVFLQNTSHVSIERVLVENMSIGVFANVSDSLLLDTVNVTLTSTYGIMLFNTTHAILRNTYILNGGYDAIIAADSQDIWIQDTRAVAPWDIGFVLYRTSYARLYNVSCCNSLGFAFGVGLVAIGAAVLQVEEANFSANDGGMAIITTLGCRTSRIIAQENDFYGIYIGASCAVVVEQSELNNNSYGVVITDSVSCSVESCITQKNEWGAYLYNSSFCTIYNLTSSSNSQEGVRFELCTDCTLNNSLLFSNFEGLALEGSQFLTIANNRIHGSQANGTVVKGSSNCIFYNNFLNNSNNCFLYNVSGLLFNTTAYTPGPNIVGGPYVGGNYWSDYTGVDGNGDGYGDTLYSLTDHYYGTTFYDYLPLVLPQDIPDNEPPTVAILSPSEDVYLPSPNVTVQWSGGDNVGIEHYEIHLYNASWDTGWINVGSDQSYRFLDLADGRYTVTVAAYDYAGNIAFDNASFTIDTVPPTVSITAPPSSSVWDVRSILLQWSVADETGVDHVEVWLNGSLIAALYGAATECQLTNLHIGTYNATIVAFDSAGNYGSDTVWFQVTEDATPPSVTIIAPLENALLNTSEVQVVWTGSDNFAIDHYEVRIDGGGWISAGGSTTYTFSGLSDGSHTVVVRAYDTAGYVAEASATFTVDTTPPVITVQSPENGSSLHTTYATVEWTAADTVSEVEGYWLQVDGGEWVYVGAATYYTFTSLAYGEHVVAIKAVDSAGNVAIAYVYFTIVQPVPWLLLTLLLTTAAVVAAAAILLYRRRRRTEKE